MMNGQVVADLPLPVAGLMGDQPAETVAANSTMLGTLLGWLGTAMESVSFFSRIYDFTYGLFNLSSVLLYVSTAVLFNFFTVRVFETRRWR